MRKGFTASVAALAAGAGMALAQGTPPPPPPTPPPGYPVWNGPGGAPPAGPMPGNPNEFLGGPGGYPGGPGPTDVPPAGDMPLYGQVAGPGSEHPYNPACEPKCGRNVGQLQKAAGGPDHWWVDVEENVWAVRSMPFAAPILTVGPVGSTGTLGEPGVKTVVGDKPVNYGEFNVLRLNLGAWDSARVWGFELSGFVSEQRVEPFDLTQTAPGTLLNNGVIARPFVDAITGLNSSLIIATPPTFGGTVSINDHMHMAGAEADLLRSLVYCDRLKVNLLVGIRYIDTNEQLDISSVSTLPNPADPTNPFINSIADLFRTDNSFLGGQFGVETELRRGRFFVDLTGKLAIGTNHESVNVAGSTTQTTGTVSTTTQGGLLALQSNIGHYSLDQFTVVPEGTAKFGFQWTQRLSTYIGINGLYMNHVARPGQQIDQVVNPTIVPVSTQFGNVFGTIRPQTLIHQSDFYTVGGTIGLSIRY